MTPYIVKQGDYIAQLAFAQGFDADAVWNDPSNADLKTLRKNPNILAPGDILYIPDKQPAELSIQQGTSNSYVAEVPKVEVCLCLVGSQGPFANEPYQIDGLGDPQTGTTGADGCLSFMAPLLARTARLSLTDQNQFLDLNIGGMDPITESSGVRKRLRSLGYSIGDEGDLEGALTSFQGDQSLPQSGQPDDATLDALAKAFGG